MPDKHPASFLVSDQLPSVAVRAAVEGLGGHGLLLLLLAAAFCCLSCYLRDLVDGPDGS
jgi:hypothetical protein